MEASRMTWYEYEKEIRDSIVLLPCGSMEQHGPHLPLSVDVVIPTNFCRMISEKVKSIILPAILYGYKSQPTSGGGPRFPGTTSLNGMTLINQFQDILTDTYRHGGRKFVLVNGHYENEAFATEAIDLFLKNAPGAKVLIISWWNQISDDLVEELFKGAGFPGWDTEHAGITETALMQYFTPELVRTDAIIDDQAVWKPTYSIFPAPSDIIPESGVLWKATYASREKGEKLAKHVAEKFVSIIRKEFDV